LLHEKKLLQLNERYNCNHRLLVKIAKYEPRRERSKKQTRRVTKENPSIFTEGLQENMYTVQLELNKCIVLIIPLTATALSLFLQCDCQNQIHLRHPAGSIWPCGPFSFHFFVPVT
jgi:hypothetical protein